ncbi:putative membrane protein [Campylobacter blaseri]|uniref:Uncharacterized protein n=1 Tax=Campylobacter blaseri TaxID=2042961 RepID=A0A2P8R1D2_9BACT|nr:hypothetical protein [Campylobacter blaseri]PSM52288.1 hypothetical protein CQ405_04340 [Campylobacter blaseri]PSM54054.1 hypothetical protein CRN67_04340 [Campylobacter blaseri]QKF85495.1 putative membrane protein [Campylobacter blaseri]
MTRIAIMLFISLGFLNAYELYGTDIRDLSILVKYFSIPFYQTNPYLFSTIFHITISFGLASLIIFSYYYYQEKVKNNPISYLYIPHIYNVAMFFIAPIESLFLVSLYILIFSIHYNLRIMCGLDGIRKDSNSSNEDAVIYSYLITTIVLINILVLN